MKRLTADPAYIDDVLARGAARARLIADQTMRDVKSIVGLLN